MLGEKLRDKLDDLRCQLDADGDAGEVISRVEYLQSVD
jgi:hypothetical protein